MYEIDQAVSDNSVVRLNESDVSFVRRDSRSNSANLPTVEVYSEFLEAHHHFNRELFEDLLPDCVYTVVRKKSVLGYFRPEAFERRDGRVAHEICLNPTYLSVRTLEETLSTLVHEMVHLWRWEFGPLNQRGGKGSTGYHDKVWADEMDRVGLPPTSTGKPGGKRTGNRVTHMIEKVGPFDISCQSLLAKRFSINWSAYGITARNGGKGGPGAGGGINGGNTKKKKDRIKFTCSGCNLNAWAKPTARFRCGECDITMMQARSEP